MVVFWLIAAVAFAALAMFCGFGWACGTKAITYTIMGFGLLYLILGAIASQGTDNVGHMIVPLMATGLCVAAFGFALERVITLGSVPKRTSRR